MKYKLAVIADSPKLHTGFGTVNAELCKGFHEEFELFVLGLLDHDINKGELPYTFFPVPPLDDLAHHTFSHFLRRVEPDAIFILTDPGNLYMYLHQIINRSVADFKRDGLDFTPTIISYTPIEGKPTPEAHADALRMVKQLNGTCVVYCDTARDVIINDVPDIEPPEVVWHGLDHAPFRKYSDEDRKIIRELAGLEDYFVVGSIGVNKRTKGFDTLIYAAQILRERGLDKGIKFYCHTNPDKDTMFGYKLRHLAKYHGVYDMFLWKQEFSPGNYWLGCDREAGTLEQCRKIANMVPDTPQGRGALFTQYDFISKINCFDIYADCSQVEGWGLPVMEAMACGVPSISVKDGHVREELHRGGSLQIDTLPPRVWTTWHSGMRLVGIDPAEVADAIIYLKSNPDKMHELSSLGLDSTSHYKWDDSRKKMNRIVRETIERDRATWQES